MTISGAVYREGVAYSPDGAMYVAVASGSSIPSPTFTGTVTHGDGTQVTQTYQFATTGTGDVAIIAQDGIVDWSFAGTNIHRFRPASYAIVNNAGALVLGTSADSNVGRTGANQLLYAATTVAAGQVTSRTEGNKAVASIANAVATDILTVTIPNAAHSASLKVKVIGSLGAGGAIGANEATATNTYDIVITRTAGVATVVAISSAYGAAASAVAGAATVTATAAPTAMTGLVSATQTFTVQVTISRSGGSSTNHTCLVYYELMNANASGVTIS